jgi:5-methylcytosine-specific restriction endonuclease McrA
VGRRLIARYPIVRCINLDPIGGRVTKAVKVSFGSNTMLRMKCPRCKKTALVIDAVIQCDCDYKIRKVPSEITFKRETHAEVKRKKLSVYMKKEILQVQDYKCAYCDCNIQLDENTHFDHFIPWVFSGNSRPYNMVASCALCNNIKYSHHFDTMEEARLYISQKRAKRNNT